VKMNGIVEKVLNKAASPSVPKQCNWVRSGRSLRGNEMVSRIVFLDTDKDWTKHGWMSMGLTLLLQQHMPRKYSNGPKLKVESNSKTQTSPLFVQKNNKVIQCPMKGQHHH